VLLNASHTHNGPTTGTWWTALFSPPDAVYLDMLERYVVTAACLARDRMRDVRLRHGAARTSFAVSRRKIGPDGLAVWEANTENTIYDRAPICAFEEPTGKPVCLLFSASCHPSTVPGRSVSADYPGVAMDTLDAHFGTECSLFLQGVGGDTKVRSCRDECAFGTTWEDQNAAGRMVSDAVAAVVASGLEPAEPNLVVREVSVDLVTDPVPDEQGFERLRDAPDTHDMKRAWAGRMLERLARGDDLPAVVPVTMHGIGIGAGVRLIGVEGEAVADHGYLLEGAFGGGTTFPMGYTDGCQMYIPSDKMLAEGGYEVDSFSEYHFPAGLAGGIDARLLAGCDGLRAAGLA